MKNAELAGDTASDAHIEVPVDNYMQTAPNDYQAAALVDEHDPAPKLLGERDDDALARPASTQQLGDLTMQRAEAPDTVHPSAAPGDDLQFAPIIPRQRARDIAVTEPIEDVKAESGTVESPKEDKLKIDGGVNEVVLRELELDDAERIVKLVSFDTEHFTSVGEVTPEVAGSVESVQSWLTSLQSSMPEGWERKELGIWHRDNMVGCTGFAAKGDRAYVWNWVGKEHTGHGYGGDSIRTLVPHLQQTGRSVIEARVREDNAASRRNMQKNGFDPVDRQNDYIRYRYGGQDDPANA